MELKKAKKANLEKMRTVFFQIGLATVLGLVILAFEWTSSDVSNHNLGDLNIDEIEEYDMMITRTPPEETAPPPVQEAPEILNIVDDDEENIEDLEPYDAESFETDFVEAPPYEEPEEIIEDEILPFPIIEEKPMFPGGEEELLKFLASNTNYPEIARIEQIEGRVFISFVIEKDGSVSDVRILRGVDPLLDNEALRVVKTMPKWKPGKQRKKPVRVKYQVPLNFKLRN